MIQRSEKTIREHAHTTSLMHHGPVIYQNSLQGTKMASAGNEIFCSLLQRFLCVLMPFCSLFAAFLMHVCSLFDICLQPLWRVFAAFLIIYFRAASLLLLFLNFFLFCIIKTVITSQTTVVLYTHKQFIWDEPSEFLKILILTSN